MKKIIIIAALSVGIMLTGCNDFLNEPLKGDFTSETIFNNSNDAQLVLTGAYNSLSFNSSSNMIWVFGDVASDDAVKGGSASDQADIGLIDEFNVRADNGILFTYWQFAYEGVKRANNVITGVYNSSIDDKAKNQMVAEAKFIRAYFYFNLVNIWGKVPLRLEPVNTLNANMPLSDVSAIYAQIEKDLNESAAVLPASYTDKADQGRATKGAAFGLLAKAQLYEKKWNECLATIEQVEGLNVYQLESNYANLFKLGAENSKEAVFAIRHLSNQIPGLGNSLNQWFAPLVEGGYYFNAPTKGYVLAFNELTADGQTDPRLDVSIGRPGKPWLHDNLFDPSWSETGYLVKKYTQPLSEVPEATKGDGGLPYHALRYADVLLMKAEAQAELNRLTDAVATLNVVRHRAGLLDAKVVNQEQVRSVIYLERRRELGFEFQRFFDLMRWGKAVATEALGANFKWEEPRYYFPLPQSERDSNRGIK